MDSLQKHFFLEMYFLKSHVSYCYSLTFSYMSLNLPPFVTTPSTLYNSHCVMALSFDVDKNYPVKWVALLFLFYVKVEKGIHTAGPLDGMIDPQQS